MDNIYDLELVVRSRVPSIVIESHEGRRTFEMPPGIAARADIDPEA